MIHDTKPDRKSSKADENQCNGRCDILEVARGCCTLLQRSVMASVKLQTKGQIGAAQMT